MNRILLFLAAFLAHHSAQAGVVVIGNLARTVNVKAGDNFEGVVFLKNTDKTGADVHLFQTDYTSQADGTNNYGEPGRAPRSNAEWITVSPTRVHLTAGETRPVRYKGRVPANSKLSGTYWSMLMVEPTSVSAPTPETKPDQVAVGLQTSIRFGIQLVTEVGKESKASLQVRDKRLVSSTAARRSLELDIGNNGERLMIPAMTVELFDKSGASVGRFDAGRARIYPECSVRAKVDLSDIPEGKYAAMVLLDSGDSQVLGAQYDLEIAPMVPVKPSMQVEGPTLVSKDTK
ncbi:MAG: hypothetical protein JWO94_2994 [Verrucomicrobiaceae bacterium]|nr:hypothetical protein [Verrucomicrobiaceae bacterium]